eukprot:TRINITY_DN16574_c0_g1_i1.p1 TRINITY_DN16574_c0_g1~~TRINITY_DN16574_c0_g1_i1.p1  ORF type:complete len:748 (-),score=177.59 TRINITY_DN16574_c0_g1_i1:408-2651(-)
MASKSASEGTLGKKPPDVWQWRGRKGWQSIEDAQNCRVTTSWLRGDVGLKFWDGNVLRDFRFKDFLNMPGRQQIRYAPPPLQESDGGKAAVERENQERLAREQYEMKKHTNSLDEMARRLAIREAKKYEKEDPRPNTAPADLGQGGNNSKPSKVNDKVLLDIFHPCICDFLKPRFVFGEVDWKVEYRWRRQLENLKWESEIVFCLSEIYAEIITASPDPKLPILGTLPRVFAAIALALHMTGASPSFASAGYWILHNPMMKVGEQKGLTPATQPLAVKKQEPAKKEPLFAQTMKQAASAAKGPGKLISSKDLRELLQRRIKGEQVGGLATALLAGRRPSTAPEPMKDLSPEKPQASGFKRNVSNTSEALPAPAAVTKSNAGFQRNVSGASAPALAPLGNAGGGAVDNNGDDKNFLAKSHRYFTLILKDSADSRKQMTEIMTYWAKWKEKAVAIFSSGMYALERRDGSYAWLKDSQVHEDRLLRLRALSTTLMHVPPRNLMQRMQWISKHRTKIQPRTEVTQVHLSVEKETAPGDIAVRLARQGKRVGLMLVCKETKPGGSFIHGLCSSMEEDLCLRSSELYPFLRAAEYYADSKGAANSSGKVQHIPEDGVIALTDLMITRHGSDHGYAPLDDPATLAAVYAISFKDFSPYVLDPAQRIEARRVNQEKYTELIFDKMQMMVESSLGANLDVLIVTDNDCRALGQCSRVLGTQLGKAIRRAGMAMPHVIISGTSHFIGHLSKFSKAAF